MHEAPKNEPEAVKNTAKAVVMEVANVSGAKPAEPNQYPGTGTTDSRWSNVQKKELEAAFAKNRALGPDNIKQIHQTMPSFTLKKIRWQIKYCNAPLRHSVQGK